MTQQVKLEVAEGQVPRLVMMEVSPQGLAEMALQVLKVPCWVKLELAPRVVLEVTLQLMMEVPVQILVDAPH